MPVVGKMSLPFAPSLSFSNMFLLLETYWDWRLIVVTIYLVSNSDLMEIHVDSLSFLKYFRQNKQWKLGGKIARLHEDQIKVFGCHTLQKDQERIHGESESEPFTKIPFTKSAMAYVISYFVLLMFININVIKSWPTILGKCLTSWPVGRNFSNESKIVILTH